MIRNHVEGADPTQPVHGLACRIILAAHHALVAELIQQAQEIGIVEFALIRFVPVRHAGQLAVSDKREKAPQRPEMLPCSIWQWKKSNCRRTLGSPRLSI